MEKYKPSPEEIKKAEDMMTPEENLLSRTREWDLQKMEEEKELEKNISEKFEGGTPPLEQNEKEATIESVIAVADKYLESLSSYGDGEQVITCLGSFSTIIALDATRLREFITTTKNRVEAGEIKPEEAFKILLCGKLPILTPEKSKELAKAVVDKINFEIEGWKKILKQI